MTSPMGAPAAHVSQKRAVARHWWTVEWPFVVIGLVLLAPRLVVSPFLPVPLLDDWLYQLSVKRLIEHHQLWVSPLAVATLVGQIGWGALFALPFGVSPAVLRISTLVAAMAGAFGLYLMGRQLGAARPLAVTGSLAVWLHPVAFVLTYTFMTDVPFLALVCLSGWLYVRGLGAGSRSALLLASICAGGAFLIRQQGALLPAAVVIWLLLYRPDWCRARVRRTIAAVVTPCLAAIIAYYGLALAVGLPSMQASFFRTLVDAGPGAISGQAWRIAVIGLFYAGICCLPLLASGWRDVWHTWRSSPADARTPSIACLAVMLAWTGVYALQHHGASFPFLTGGQVIRPDGFVTDAYGARPDLLPKGAWLALAVALAFATSAAVLLIVRSVLAPDRDVPPNALRGKIIVPRGGGVRHWLWRRRSFAGDGMSTLLALFALAQFGGIVPAALYRPELVTYDRYLLPVFPFVVGLVVRALRGGRWSPAPVIALFVVMLALNTLGMQDWLAYKVAEWQTDQWLTTSQGVPLNQVDGYGQWVGLHFYEQTIFGPPQAPVAQAGAAWWLRDIAPGLDPVYVVAAAPDVRAGYVVVARRPYRSWVRPGSDSWVYVLKRQDAPEAGDGVDRPR